MPITTARKSTGGYQGPPREWRVRGIPRLATYEPPSSPPRLRKKPGAKRKTAIKKVVEAKAVESPKSFNLLGLPAELRNTIYELCVSASNYIAYDDRDFCTCGKQVDVHDSTEEDHDKDGCSCSFKIPRWDDHEQPCSSRRPGRFYVMTINRFDERKLPCPPSSKQTAKFAKKHYHERLHV